MAVTSYVFPSFTDALAAKKINLASDTLQVLLVASGTYTWNSTANSAVTVANFLTANGTLTEVSTSGTGYSRATLSSVSVGDTFSTPHNYTSLIVGTNPSWSSATFSASSALFYDNTVGGTDSTNQVIAYWDLGGAQSVTASTFTLAMGAANSVSNALVQWTSN
jgi:hypothetical protein